MVFICGVFMLCMLLSFNRNGKNTRQNLLVDITISIIFFIAVLITYNKIIEASKIENLKGQWGLIRHRLFGDSEIIIGGIPIFVSLCYLVKNKINSKTKYFIFMLIPTAIWYITAIDFSLSLAYFDWHQYLYDCMASWFIRYFCLLIGINLMFRILDNKNEEIENDVK